MAHVANRRPLRWTWRLRQHQLVTVIGCYVRKTRGIYSYIYSGEISGSPVAPVGSCLAGLANLPLRSALPGAADPSPSRDVMGLRREAINRTPDSCCRCSESSLLARAGARL